MTDQPTAPDPTGTTDPPPAPPPRKRRRWLRYVSWSLLALFLIILAALGFVLSTQSGLDTVLALAHRVLPGTLTYQGIQGRLIGPLNVTGLRYRDGDLDVKLGKAEFDWSPSALLGANVHIHRIHADAIEIHLPPPAPPEPEQEPFALTDIRLPVSLRLDDLNITNLRLFNHGAEQPVVIDGIALKAETQGNALVINTLTVKAPQGDAALDGRLEPLGAYPLAVNLTGQFRHPDYGPLDARIGARGELGNTLILNLDTAGLAVVKLEGEARQVLKDPAWTALLELAVEDLRKFAPDLAASGVTARLRTQGTPRDFQASGEVNSALPDLGPLTAAFKLAGNPQKLRIDELALRAADNPLSLIIQGDADLVEQKVNANARWQSLRWPLTGAAQVESPSGELVAQGTLQAYTVELKAAVAGPDIGKLDARLKAAGTPQAITLNELTVRAPSPGDLALNARGELNFAGLDFTASGDWKSLAWPLAGIPQVQSPAGSFKASGNLKNYQFELNTDVQGPNVPKGAWRLQGQGSAEALDRLDITGKTLEGTLTGKINAAWKPAVRWQAELAGDGLNPGAQWRDMAGKLGFKLQTQGALNPDGLEADANLDDLAGTLRNQTVQGKAQVSVKNQDVAIQALQLRAGEARLDVNGSLRQNWDMNWQLDVPALNRLLPGASGAIQGAGKLAGPRAQPDGNLTLGVRGFGIGDTKIQRLQAEARVDPDGSSPSRLKVQGEGLSVAGQTWERLALDGNGTPARHSLQAEMNGTLGRFALALNGGLTGQTWQGQLTRLSALNTEAGNWNLERPVALLAGADQAKAEALCLASSPSRICAQGQWAAKTGANGRLTLERINPDRFAARLPPNVKINTGLNGELNGSLQPNGAVQGRVNLRFDPGRIETTANGQPVNIDLGGGTLQAEATGKDANAKLNMNLGKLGQINGDVQLRDIPGQRRIAGKVNGEIRDFSLVSVFAPQVQNVSGRLLADLELSGALPMLALKGGVRLENAAVEVPAANLRVREIQVQATSDGTGPLQVAGSARSGDGDLKLAGQIDPITANVNLTIQGENFQLANSPEIRALISPDMKLAVTQDQIRVDGQITIPKAFLSPPEGTGPGRVKASEDVVIVEKNGAAGARKPGQALFARVRVTLGDDVQVAAAGFKGQLKGSLLIEQTPQLAPRGTGNLEVAAGEYKIYGQDLRIERGRVLFSGSPVDNPGLDLRVSRQFDNNVTAGAEITGTAKRPKLELFSIPNMSDTSVLSYLVLGRAPDQTSASENAMLYRAASAMGSGALTNMVAGATGLDDVKFESGASPQQAAVVLGKYLTPDLYVGYGVGMFEGANSFRLRYRINQRLKLEATNNATGTGGDLLYTLER